MKSTQSTQCNEIGGRKDKSKGELITALIV